MKLVKLSLVTAVAAFIISCSQPTPTPTTNTVVSNAPSSNVVVVAKQTGNRTANVDPKKARLIAADSVDDMAASETSEVYATNCMICHKDTGKGGKVSIEGKNLRVADLTSEKMKKHSDEKLFEYISDGLPDEGMPAFKGKLSEDQIRSVVAHVRALQSK